MLLVLVFLMVSAGFPNLIQNPEDYVGAVAGMVSGCSLGSLLWVLVSRLGLLCLLGPVCRLGLVCMLGLVCSLGLVCCFLRGAGLAAAAAVARSAAVAGRAGASSWGGSPFPSRERALSGFPLSVLGLAAVFKQRASFFSTF